MRVTMASLLLPVALGGCGICHQMRAPDTVQVELTSADWAPGLYEVELQGSGQVAMCALELPATESTVISCTEWASVELSPDGRQIERLVVEEFAPPSFTATVLRDGQVLSEEQIAPDYTIDEPNGPGCGDRAQATVVLAF